MGKRKNCILTDMVSSRLRRLRKKNGYSQAFIAKEQGCTQSAINRYEHGEAEAPYKSLLWYAEYFNVSLDYIFGRTNDCEELHEDSAEEREERLDDREWAMLVELCFTKGTASHEKLKGFLLGMRNDMDFKPVESDGFGIRVDDIGTAEGRDTAVMRAVGANL